MTPTVKIAARRWPRTSISTATTSVMIVMPTVPKMTSMTRSGPISQPESTAYSAAGEPRLSNCATGPQPWTTATSTSAEQQERQQRPAQEHEAGAVQHGQKYDGVGPRSRHRRTSTALDLCNLA